MFVKSTSNSSEGSASSSCWAGALPVGSQQWQENIQGSSISVEWTYGNVSKS